MQNLFLACLLLLPTTLFPMEKDTPEVFPNETLSNIWTQFTDNNYEELRPEFYESIALTSKNQYRECLNIYKERLVDFFYDIIVLCDRWLLTITKKKQVAAIYDNIDAIIALEFENMDETLVNELKNDETKMRKFRVQTRINKIQKLSNFKLANTINRASIENLIFKGNVISFKQVFKNSQNFLKMSLEQIYQELAISYDVNCILTPLRMHDLLINIFEDYIAEDIHLQDSMAVGRIPGATNYNKNDLPNSYRLFQKMTKILKGLIQNFPESLAPFISYFLIKTKNSKDMDYILNLFYKSIFIRSIIERLIKNAIVETKQISLLEEFELTNSFTGKYAISAYVLLRPGIFLDVIMNQYATEIDSIGEQYSDKAFVEEIFNILLEYEELFDKENRNILSLAIRVFPSIKDKITKAQEKINITLKNDIKKQELTDPSSITTFQKIATRCRCTIL